MELKFKEALDNFLWWAERSQDDKYIERKKSLIDRDPNTADFLKELKQYNPSQVYSTKKMYQSLFLGAQPVTVHCYKRPKKLEELKNLLEEKWNVSISITSESNHIATLERQKPLSTKEVFKIYHFDKNQRKEPIQEISSTDRDQLMLQFDLNLLNKSTNSEKFVKDTVWAVVRKKLDKEETSSKDEIYSMRKNTFEKYLHWYDLKIDEKLGFRILAVYEKNKNKAAFLEKVRCKKIKWGIPVKGEDKIEKGIKLIYYSIHRKPYTHKNREPQIEEYSCPTHTTAECPISCKYYKQWTGRFNRLNPV